MIFKKVKIYNFEYNKFLLGFIVPMFDTIFRIFYI